jgi:hypothetical protein
MNNVSSISFGFVYNPEEVEIQDIFSNINSLKPTRLENEKGITTLILNFKNPQTIKK